MTIKDKENIKMGEKHENTNLAAEFYVLSMLYRKGLDASLTLGNKKSIDIRIFKKNKVISIDVKGIKEKSSGFPFENVRLINKNHFFVFVSFKDISNHLEKPEIYIVPSIEINKDFSELQDYKCSKKLIYVNPSESRKVVDLCRLRKLKSKYEDKWDYFL